MTPALEANSAKNAEVCAPTPSKPWRIVWGFGGFHDFATEAEAAAFYNGISERERRMMAVTEPFQSGPA